MQVHACCLLLYVVLLIVRMRLFSKGIWRRIPHLADMRSGNSVLLYK